MNIMPRLTTSVLLILLCSILTACGGGGSSSSPETTVPATTSQTSTSTETEAPTETTAAYSYTQPTDNHVWPTEHLSNTGLSEASFERMLNQRDMEALNIHSILVVKNKQLVFEEYFSGQNSQQSYVEFDRNTPHEMFSVTKSVTSLLAGKAIEDGHIGSTDDYLISYLPEHADLFNADGKVNLTLYHALTMQSGIQWDEFISTTANSSYQFKQAEEPIRYVLSLPQVTSPGTRFTYNTGLTSVLGEALSAAINQRIDTYAQNVLFSPLQIDNVTWQEHSNGHIFTGTGLQLTPLSMTKIGQLVLDGGNWDGRSLIPESWINESTQPHVSLSDAYTADNYGYLWWLSDFQLSNGNMTPAIYAAGFGGQLIYILPEVDMVVVLTAGNFQGENPNIYHTLMTEDIVPSIQ